jgi:vacuolar-type H+-ATPase subunit E/Vma4/nitrogen regulatory protein PII-like uncharacterized protein
MVLGHEVALTHRQRILPGPARPLRAAISAVTAASIALAQLPILALTSSHAFAQTNALSRADYEQCQARDEQGFRTAIENLTYKGLQAGVASIDYRAVIRDEWRKTNLDDVIDRQVDQAINEVRDETSWGKLITSLGSKDKAQELATTVAERVFKSEGMKKALETLATGVGSVIGKKIEAATVDTAEPAMTCMQAFLGPRYGSTIARVVSRDAAKEYAVDPTKGTAGVSTGQVLTEHADGIAGAVVLLVRRQLSNMASRVGARMVGSVLSRLVSVVAGGVGVVLIAKDIWDMRHGVLPIIASEMKSRDTKDKIQDELAKAISEQIGENLHEIAAKTAIRVVDIWQEFRRAHAKVIELADSNASFKSFLETVKADSMPRLDEVVGLVLAAEGGEAGVLKRLSDGTLGYAVNVMPSAGIDIAREARSIETSLQWSALAGDKLPQILTYEIHRRAKPEAFSKASLEKLLALNDKVAVTRLAALSTNARTPLFELTNAELIPLARAMTETELASLSGYLTGLEKPAGQRLLHAVAQVPSRMQTLSAPRVYNAVVASRDQLAAVGMMLASDTVPDPWQVAAHAQLVIDGKVSPILLWEKHNVFVVTAAILSLVLLSMLKRLLFGRRQKIIIQQVQVPSNNGAAGPIRTAQTNKAKRRESVE